MRFILWRTDPRTSNCVLSWNTRHWTTLATKYIQGVSRLVDITAGGDFLGLCDQKSLYKHVSDFGRLRSYGHFLIPVHVLVWTVSSESAGEWCTELGGLSFALQALLLPPDSPTQLQTVVQFPYLDTWKVFKECGEGGVGGCLPGQCILHDWNPLSLTLQGLCRLLMG